MPIGRRGNVPLGTSAHTVHPKHTPTKHEGGGGSSSTLNASHSTSRSESAPAAPSSHDEGGRSHSFTDGTPPSLFTPLTRSSPSDESPFIYTHTVCGGAEHNTP